MPHIWVSLQRIVQDFINIVIETFFDNIDQVSIFSLAVRLQMTILDKRKLSDMYGKEMAFQSLLRSCATGYLPYIICAIASHAQRREASPGNLLFSGGLAWDSIQVGSLLSSFTWTSCGLTTLTEWCWEFKSYVLLLRHQPHYCTAKYVH